MSSPLNLRHMQETVFGGVLPERQEGAAKVDALQELILKSVLRNPRLTEKELLRILHENKSDSFIWDIDKQFVYYKSKGRDKQAAISGLKDRLARAKKKLQLN